MALTMEQGYSYAIPSAYSMTGIHKTKLMSLASIVHKLSCPHQSVTDGRTLQAKSPRGGGRHKNTEFDLCDLEK